MTFDAANLFAVNRSQLDEVWPAVEPFLRRFEAETQTTTVDIMRSKLDEAEAQLWCYAEDGEIVGVGLTEVYEHHRGRFCRVWVICGDLEPYLQGLAHAIEKWAESIGCTAVEINGRRGWARVLEGYKTKAWVIEKDLRTVH